jgi:hypothetical protein
MSVSAALAPPRELLGKVAAERLLRPHQRGRQAIEVTPAQEPDQEFARQRPIRVADADRSDEPAVARMVSDVLADAFSQQHRRSEAFLMLGAHE